MLTEIFTLIAGVILIVFLADQIVKYAVQIAKHFGISGSFIGLTVLSIGTSIPEIMTHIIGSVNILREPSSITTLSGLLIGTSTGSDIFQQTIILSIVALLGAVIVKRSELPKQLGALIIAAVLTWFFALNGFISRIEGVLMFAVYIGYLLYLAKETKKTKSIPEKLSTKEFAVAVFLILGSFVLMTFVADFVLKASTSLLEVIGLSASLFGILILGVMTALPELTTSLIAALKEHKGMSAGILLGSNITNPLMGIGLGAIVSSYTVPSVVYLFDLPMKIFSGLLLFIFMWRNGKLDKWEALVMICLFVAFIALRVHFFPTDL